MDYFQIRINCLVSVIKINTVLYLIGNPENSVVFCMDKTTIKEDMGQ